MSITEECSGSTLELFNMMEMEAKFQDLTGAGPDGSEVMVRPMYDTLSFFSNFKDEAGELMGAGDSGDTEGVVDMAGSMEEWAVTIICAIIEVIGHLFQRVRAALSSA